MKLLRFAVTNHRSLRDRAELDLRRTTLRTLKPRPDEQWIDHIYPVVGIFGANASGKSTVIDALDYAMTAVRLSSTTWQASPTMRRAPFLLAKDHAEAPSTYEFDFVLDETRYEYGFTVDGSGIVQEWLKDLPRSRWRTLMSRDRSTGLRLHPSVTAFGSVTDRELALSRAILLRHMEFAPIGTALVEGIDVAPLEEHHREHRLGSITEALTQGELTFDDLVTLLQIADIGVAEVSVREESIPPEILEKLRAVARVFRDEPDSGASESGSPLSDDASEAVIRSLEFTHRGADNDTIPPFGVNWESQGTIAWLSLIVPAVEALHHGTLLCVDEIDASLHSHLADTLIGFFTDLSVNKHGAQLIFTSHDTYLLSPLSEARLEPEQIWFTEKDKDGASELFSLAEFPRHQDANIARRYLGGRFGAVPSTAPTALQRVLESRSRSAVAAS